MDIPIIVTALAGIKKAIEIAGSIIRSDVTLEKAELKLRLSEIVTSLAEANTKITDIRAILDEKEARIAELEEALRNKARAVKRGDAYFDLGGANPRDCYCVACWEQHHRLIHLVRRPAGYTLFYCPSCKNEVSAYNIGWPKAKKE